MLPSILPGSSLAVRAVGSERPRVGDVVCFPGRSGNVVAHRVVGVEDGVRGGDERLLVIRGDAHSVGETVSLSAIAYRVTRVSYGPFGYDCDGALGKMISRVVLRFPRAVAAAGGLARVAGPFVKRSLGRVGVLR